MDDGRLRITLLGQFALTQAGRPVTALHAPRPQSLLAYLLLHQDAPISRQHLAFTLWPDSTDEQARTNLRNLLHVLRHALPDADQFLALDTHTLRWLPDAPCWLDVAQFRQALAAAAATAASAATVASTASTANAWPIQRGHLETAVSLYAGPLLPGNYDDWIIPLREELHQEYLDALGRLALLLETAGETQAAIRYARQRWQQDLLDESSVILLMRLHAQRGDQANVRRTYQECEAALRQGLDAEPAPETQAAYAAALTLAAAARQRWPEEGQPRPDVITPGRPSPRRAVQLPPQPTPFVGRDLELARMAQLLADPDCRLVTIVGPGGAGKTRLAIQSATGHVTIFTHGAAFVALASLADATLIPAAIAAELGLPVSPVLSRAEQLLQYLADKELLLVLDNLEHLPDSAAVLADILAAAPRVRILATSRQRLHLPHEWVFPLQGLPLPEAGRLDQLEESSAAALFLNAARRQDAAFAPADAERAAIARICTLVDGMPLGLELAAAWVRLLSCAEIGDEIEKNLDFLAAPQRELPGRHYSMRAVFNQTWQMLAGTEQAVFGRLSLFRGGFERDAAEQVAGADLLTLSALLDKSLVRRRESGRYEVHELLRQYAAAELAAHDAPYQEAQADFTAYFLHLAETAARKLDGPDQLAWLERLDQELDNLRAALSWATSLPDEDTSVRLGAALGRYWWLRFLPAEGGDWLRRVLALPGPLTTLRARVMSYAGLLARLRRDYTAAQYWLEQSIAAQRDLGNQRDLGRSINELGMLFLDLGDFRRARDLFLEWLDLARQLDFPHGIAIALLNLGMSNHHLGEFDGADAYYRQGLDLARAAGLQIDEAMILNSYAGLLVDQGRIPQARSTLEESVRLNLELDYQDGIAWALYALITLAHAEGRPDAAARLLGALDTQRQKLGSPLPPTNQKTLDAVIAGLRLTLGEETLDRQLQAGRHLPLPAALALIH